MINTIAARNQFLEKNFNVINSSIRAAVYSYLASKGSKTLRSDEIEDVCSDTMVKVVKKADSYSTSKGAISTWVSSIAVRTLLDAIDAKDRRNDKFVRADEGWEDETQKTYEMITKVTAEDHMIAEQTQQQIEDFTSTLSESDKVILEMTEDGYKPKEIAKELNKTPGSIYVAKCKLLSNLETALAA